AADATRVVCNVSSVLSIRAWRCIGHARRDQARENRAQRASNLIAQVLAVKILLDRLAGCSPSCTRSGRRSRQLQRPLERVVAVQLRFCRRRSRWEQVRELQLAIQIVENLALETARLGNQLPNSRFSIAHHSVSPGRSPRPSAT